MAGTVSDRHFPSPRPGLYYEYLNENYIRSDVFTSLSSDRALSIVAQSICYPGCPPIQKGDRCDLRSVTLSKYAQGLDRLATNTEQENTLSGKSAKPAGLDPTNLTLVHNT